MCMKKIYIRVLFVVMYVVLLCGCESTTVVSLLQNNSTGNTSTSNSSLIHSDQEVKLIQYKGKEDYQFHSLGPSLLFQNEKYYYYSDEFGFFAIDKQTKEQVFFSKELMLGMCVFEDKIYFPKNGEVVVFDTKTHEFEEKSYKELLSLRISVPQTRYNLSILMIKDGWLVSVEDNEWGTKKVYLTDYNFTTKTLIPISSFDFVLDDDIFILDKSGNVFCYNYNTKEDSYVTTDFDITKDEYNFLASRNFAYLGKDRILAYSDNKLLVISLKDGSTCLEIPLEAENAEQVWAETLWDDENIYLFLEQSEYSYILYSISYTNNKPQTIYQTKIDLPVTNCGLADIDENYLYLHYSSYYDEEGNPLSYYSRINKDGTGEETVFKTKIPNTGDGSMSSKNQ